MSAGPTPGQELYISRVEGTRISRARIPSGRNAFTTDQVMTRLLGARSRSTWEGLSGTWKQFLVFVEQTFPVEGDGPAHEWKIMYFLEAKLQAKLIGIPTAHKYLKQLKQTSKRLDVPFDNELLLDYDRSLLRDGALKPENQAPPATRDDIERALQVLTEDEAVGLMIAWKTCSRIGELQYLRRTHFNRVEQDLWTITFPYHKGDPFRLGTTIAVRMGGWHEFLCRRLELTDQAQSITTLTTARAEAVLGAVRAGLTAHSVKRGGLTTLLLAKVPMSIIQVIAKHRDLDTLLHYLPREEVALALGMHEATNFL